VLCKNAAGGACEDITASEQRRYPHPPSRQPSPTQASEWHSAGPLVGGGSANIQLTAHVRLTQHHNSAHPHPSFTQPRRTHTSKWYIAKALVGAGPVHSKVAAHVTRANSTASEQRTYPHPPSPRPKRSQATEWRPARPLEGGGPVHCKAAALLGAAAICCHAIGVILCTLLVLDTTAYPCDTEADGCFTRNQGPRCVRTVVPGPACVITHQPAAIAS
jgi:hypothetical protein